MKVLSFLCYFFAGMFLKNSGPHLVVAATGRRNITPFGKNSLPYVNLLWCCMNVAGGCLLARYADRKENVRTADSKAWQIPFETGCLALSIFGVLYSWITASHELRKEPEISVTPVLG